MLKITWEKIVERKNSVLCLHFIVRGQNIKRTFKVLGKKLGYEYFFSYDKECFLNRAETMTNMIKLRKLVEIEGYDVLLNFALKWEILSNTLINFAKKLTKSFWKKTNKDLINLFKKYTEINYDLSTSAQLPLNIEKILENKIKKLLAQKLKKHPKEIERYFSILTTPEKLNENEKELKSLLSIGVLVQRKKWNIKNPNKELYQLIDQHIKKFGWINTQRFLGDPWSRKEIIERLKNISERNDQERLIESGKKKIHNEKESKRIITKLRFSKKEKLIIKIARKYIFLRTFRINAFTKAGFITRPFMTELAKRMNLTFSDLIYLSPDEITNFFEKRKTIPMEIIKRRKESFGLLITPKGVVTLSGESLKKYSQKIFPKNSWVEISVIKGTMASSGVAIGQVKIVKSHMDLAKVTQGDILVAPMTTPNFVSAMEKTAGIITDEGGITCHAAIVSRELNIPCIINTKIATKVLKDGDLVEMDATKGIIRKIK